MQTKSWNLLFGLLFTISIVSAQNRKVEYGLKTGLNYSNFIANNEENALVDYGGDIGYYIGSFLSINLTEKLKLKPEIVFSKLNVTFQKLTYDDPNTLRSRTVYGKIKESLIWIPVMLDFYLNKSFDIEVGSHLGFVLNRNITYNHHQRLEFGETDIFELGVNFGLGYNIAKKYRVSVRYSYGITQRQNLHSSVFQLGLSYKI